MKRTGIAFMVLVALVLPAAAGAQSFIDWKNLHNPVLSYSNWSVKDCAMAYRDGTFYIFFSAFYMDHSRVRSHVVEVSTKDFKTFSKPIVDFDGEKAGWIGMCSPDVQRLGKIWELSFNSWGDDPKRPDQLFYMTSPDLVHWSRRRPLAPNLTTGESVIDLTVTRAGRSYYALWRQGKEGNALRIHPRLAAAKSLSGPWHFVGLGYATLKMADGKENGLIHENYELVWIDGVLHLLSNDYLRGAGAEYLYALSNPQRPLNWTGGFRLSIPAQGFNQMVPSTAAALYDWRKHDGYFYLIYAGRNEEKTYLHRGWNRIALARSKDLAHWVPAGSSN